MPCGAHTSGMCICPLLSCASHRPLAALSSRLHPFLFLLVVSILLVLLLVLLVALFLSFIYNSAEFGVQLELAFECVNSLTAKSVLAGEKLIAT